MVYGQQWTFGNPNKIINVLKSLYNKSQSAVRVNEDLIDWLATTDRVRQGCMLSPQLFNILVCNWGGHWCKHPGRKISNLRFADDIVLMAESAEGFQTLVDRVHYSCSNVGLKINIGKTEVQAISRHVINLNITIKGLQLVQVQEFTHLGGKITEKGQCTPDIKQRIQKALGAVQIMHNIRRSKEISNATKLELYKTLILSILLHGAETWTIKKKDENRLLTFEMTCLRKTIWVTRLERIRNEHIRQQVGMTTTIVELVASKRLRFLGHIKRMISYRCQKIILGAYTHGDRPRGRPAKWWEDCVKAELRSYGLDSPAEATWLAEDRKKWKSFVNQKPSHSLGLVWTA